MQTWIRCCGTFCTGVTLVLATFLSLSSTTANSNSATARATSHRISERNFAVFNNDSINVSDVRQTTRPRWIEIDLSEQRLSAWEGKKLVHSYRISTGKRSTPTPIGRFRINSKYRTHRMRGRGYNIPNVPYTMYFYKGYAIHGAFWHKRFGTPVSHGCVNLPVQQARKLYNWTSIGTLVVVRR